MVRLRVWEDTKLRQLNNTLTATHVFPVAHSCSIQYITIGYTHVTQNMVLCTYKEKVVISLWLNTERQNTTTTEKGGASGRSEHTY